MLKEKKEDYTLARALLRKGKVTVANMLSTLSCTFREVSSSVRVTIRTCFAWIDEDTNSSMSNVTQHPRTFVSSDLCLFIEWGALDGVIATSSEIIRYKRTSDFYKISEWARRAF